jgi:hypothetical protein
MKVHKTPLHHLLLPLMINLSKRQITVRNNNSKATGTGRESVKGKERRKGKGRGNANANANAREIESAGIREAEPAAMTAKEAAVGIMAAERVIGGLQHRPLRKREEMGITTEINIRGKMITPNTNCKKHLQT